MKRINHTLALLGLGLSALLNAQTSKVTSTQMSNQQIDVAAPEAKTNYINSQNYLSASSLKDYKSFYGDSLKGFDEKGTKVDLLSRHFYGAEFIQMMNSTKREFIDKKYNIGFYDPTYLQQLHQQWARPNINNNPGSPNIGGKPIGGNNQINIAPCVNEDFELTAPGAYLGAPNFSAVSGYSIYARNNNGGVTGACASGQYSTVMTGFTAGSPEFWIMQTPILGVPFIGTIPHSPLGGTRVAKLNDANPGVQITRLISSFPVTNANSSYQFAFCGSWDGSGHSCCDQPSFQISLYDCAGNLLTCASQTLTAPGPNCAGNPANNFYNLVGGVSWCSWQNKYIDLTPFIGQCITVMVTNTDCSGGAHHGSLYYDARCGGQYVNPSIPPVVGTVPGAVSFCAGSNVASIAAPLGYASYTWTAPFGAAPIAPAQATQVVLQIANPVVGATYTVTMYSAAACSFTYPIVLTTTTVGIVALGASPTCPGGTSGSASVQAQGSATGYNYVWLNSSSVTVGTASSVAGLAPGVYSVIVTGAGAAGCGTAKGTVTVGVGLQQVINLLKPFCNGQAYLNTTGGSNFKWYNGNSLIPPAQGGIAPGYTVTSPFNGQIMWLSYTSPQNCQDSIQFTLIASAPGSITIPYNKLICPGGTNGEAIISLTPAPGAPPGANSFSVFAISPTPAYNSSVYPTPAVQYSVGNLAAGGTYSVKVFDGSCLYSTSFVVPFYNWSYNLTPNATLCQGSQIASGVNFPGPVSPGQYTYSWSPTTFLAANLGNLQNTIISPTTPIGTQTTIIYTVVVTPTIAFCPITKTLGITIVNPATPTINVIPPLCNNSSPYSVIVTPPGGTFVALTGTNFIGSASGVITPTLCFFGNNNNGLNAFTYSTTTAICVATQSISFVVSQFNTAALSASVAPLCVTNAPFNLMNIVQSATNGTWTAPAGVFQPGVGQYNFNPSALQTSIYPITYTTTSSPDPSACPHFTTINVSVTKTITPFITPVPVFCNNASSMNMTVNPSGGIFQGTGVSGAGVITPTNYNQAGNYTIGYTVNIGPCVNTNTTSVAVAKYNTANLTTGVLPNLCFNSPAFNLMTIVQNTLGAWSGSAGVNYINNTYNFDPTNLPNSVHTLTYSNLPTNPPNFNANNLCSETSTISVFVSNPPVPNITQVGPYCSNGGPIQLTVTPNTGVWSASSFLTNTGILTPSLCGVGSNAVQYVIGTNSCNKQQTKFINIEAFVPATISYSVADQCNSSSPVNLSPNTISNLGIWSGTGISGTMFNPAVAGAGQFILTYNTSSSPSGLCPDQATVAVRVFSLAPPVFSNVKTICNSSHPLQILVNPVGGLFGGVNTSGVNNKGLFNPGLGVIGANVINYSITAGPCVAYAQTTVNVEKFVSSAFELYPGPYCKTHEAVDMNSFVQNPGGMWKGDGIAGNKFDPAKANIGSNNVITYQTHSMPTATLCPDETTVRIVVQDLPKISAYLANNSGCAPLDVQLNVQSVNSGKGVWNFGDGSEPQTAFSTTHLYTTPGTYTVVFSYEDGIACSAQMSVDPVVTVNEVPVANFSVPEEILVSNPEVQLTNLTGVLTKNKYTWKIPDLAFASTEIHPKVTLPEKLGRYQITLIAETPNHCKDSMMKFVEVKNDFNIFIPTSFSPNYDGLNDFFKPEFTPYGLDEKSFEMEIFDRWGHSLFRTRDPKKGWDGSLLNKGEPLKEEVYVYRIKYKDLDGNAYSKMGHVSLIK